MIYFNPLPPHGGRRYKCAIIYTEVRDFNPLPPHGGRQIAHSAEYWCYSFQSTPSAWRETSLSRLEIYRQSNFNPLPPHGGRHRFFHRIFPQAAFQSTPSAWRETFQAVDVAAETGFQSTPSAWRETSTDPPTPISLEISIHSLRMEGDSKTAQESVFHFAYPCTILQKRMQKTTFCTRKNGFFRKKGEKFGAKPSASFCAPMIRTDTFPLNFSHRISGSSMSMVSFAPICSTFD